MMPFLPLVEAIRQQESGGRINAVSPQGARGSWQIMPATFRQYARKGESFDNSQDVDRVAVRALRDVYENVGGDASRTAVGWFSGLGNVAHAGSQLPYKRNSSDATGKNVGSYVRDVWARLASAERWSLDEETWTLNPEETWQIDPPIGARSISGADLVEPR